MVNSPTSQPAATPALAMALAHCTFSDDGRMTHWVNTLPADLYNNLPNLFVASIMKNVSSGSVVAGCSLFVIDAAREDPKFKQYLDNIILITPNIAALMGKRTRVICVQLVKPPQPLSEDRIIFLFMDEFTKRGMSGSA